jgi:protein involved in polysaccharide export with SLBB domain
MPSALSQPETARAVEGLPADYRLRPGDRLKVEVLGEEAMSTATAVLADNGTLTLPIAGPVSVAGKTLEEATRAVREFLGADYLVDPQVKLTLLQTAQTTTPSPPGTPLTRTADEIWPGVRPPPQVIAVDSPQPQASPTPTATRATPSKTCQFSIFNQVRKPGRYQWNCDERMTLLRAIGMAGGATARADLSRVSIRRMIDGRRVASEHDLQALALDPNALPPLLQSGDEVEVPRE